MVLATLMASSSLARALLVRWRITVPGILLSLGLAAAMYGVFPPLYNSSSTVVLIPAAQHGRNTLLSFDTGLSTSAEILVQGMNDPQVATDMGLVAGQDKVTVVNGNAGSNGKIVESGGPFISVSTQSSTPARATALAAQATSGVEDKLAELQQSVKVSKNQSINVSTVVSPTPGKVAVDTLLRSMGLAMLFGCGLTVAAVCMVDRRGRRNIPQAQPDFGTERVTAQAALRSASGILHRLDPFDEFDALAASTEPIDESSRSGQLAADPSTSKSDNRSARQSAGRIVGRRR